MVRQERLWTGNALAVLSGTLLGSLLMASALGAQGRDRGPIAAEMASASDLAFLANVDSERWQLTVVGNGVVVTVTSEVDPPTLPLEDQDGKPLPDGEYQFELRTISTDEQSGEWIAGQLFPLSGTFRVQGGARVVASALEGAAPDGSGSDAAGMEATIQEQSAHGLQTKTSASATLEQGNACIGAHCPASPGGPYPSTSAWLKLQGLGTGVIFADHNNVSGTCASRGCRDWQIVVNEYFNVGDYFAIADLGTGGGVAGGADGVGDSTVETVPFRIDGQAPTDSLRISSSSGNVGMGTATAAQELEIFSADPTIRLSDAAGHEWNLNNSPNSGEFDIVSTSSGAASTRHFFIQRSAPADQLMLTTTGIGIGTQTPSATIEIEGDSGTSQLLIDEQGADAAVEVMFNLVCDCAPAFRMQNTVNGRTWFFRHLSGGNFSFDDPNSAGQEMILTSAGNLTLKGSLSQGSSRALKENLEPANGASVLEALSKLDLYEWSYIDEGARHFGPMAEEFSAAYGLGESKAKIAPSDMAGLALAASKTLAERLERENSDLRSRVQHLESLVEQVLAREQRKEHG